MDEPIQPTYEQLMCKLSAAQSRIAELNRERNELDHDANRYQAIRSVVMPYAWLAHGTGCHAYDEMGAYQADVQHFMKSLLECFPPFHDEPFQSVLAERNRLKQRVEKAESDRDELLMKPVPASVVITTLQQRIAELERKAQFASAQLTSCSDAFSAMKVRAEQAERDLATERMLRLQLANDSQMHLDKWREAERERDALRAEVAEMKRSAEQLATEYDRQSELLDACAKARESAERRAAELDSALAEARKLLQACRNAMQIAQTTTRTDWTYMIQALDAALAAEKKGE